MSERTPTPPDAMAPARLAGAAMGGDSLMTMGSR